MLSEVPSVTAVHDVFKPCFCKNVRVQEYQNQVAMQPFWREKLIAIDSCLASEIAWLWQHGIVTHGCCCGHGDATRAYIGVYAKHIEQMKRLGYRQYAHGKHPAMPEQHFIPLTIMPPILS
jgi:hypothetical protein